MNIRPRVVRIELSDEEWKRLQYLTIEREQSMMTLVTEALRTSPLTKSALQKAAA